MPVSINDVVVGDGDEVSRYAIATVYFTVMALPNVPIDGALDLNETIDVNVGGANIITGFTNGLLGITNNPNDTPMRVGGKRVMNIPPELAYGGDGIPGYVPGAVTLFFDVELRAVREVPDER
jgi:FKBP-type peptidyl-prolyl cis-trans isomerase